MLVHDVTLMKKDELVAASVSCVVSTNGPTPIVTIETCNASDFYFVAVRAAWSIVASVMMMTTLLEPNPNMKAQLSAVVVISVDDGCVPETEAVTKL